MGKRSFGNFFAFKWMITPDIIRVVYVLGLILNNLSLLGSYIGGLIMVIISYEDWGLSTTLLIVVIVVGTIASIIVSIIMNLLWRMFCEQIILFFSIHETLVSIEDLNKPRAERQVNRRDD